MYTYHLCLYANRPCVCVCLNVRARNTNKHFFCFCFLGTRPKKKPGHMRGTVAARAQRHRAKETTSLIDQLAPTLSLPRRRSPLPRWLPPLLPGPIYIYIIRRLVYVQTYVHQTCNLNMWACASDERSVQIQIQIQIHVDIYHTDTDTCGYLCSMHDCICLSVCLYVCMYIYVCISV